MNESPEKNGKGRILVVDDDKAIRSGCRYLLEMDGYQVEVAEDGRKALDRMSQAEFDVVLTDLQMPVLDGLGLLKEIQKRPNPPTVVMFTAFASVQSAVEAMKLGAYDYLPKPVDSDHLSMTIRRSFETHRLKKEVEARTKELEARTAELQETLATLKNSQNQLIDQAKLAALGKVASEVAHELRNPLAVAFTAIQLLRSQAGKAPSAVGPLDREASPGGDPGTQSQESAGDPELDVEQAWDAALRNIKRANEVINNFFALSKNSELALAPCDVKPLFDDIETMIRGKCMRQKVALEIKISESLPQVNLSAPHFKSAILNLAINALEALPPEGGKLLLAAQPRPESRVAFVVEDTGPGIPLEFQNKIFDAFFTTKEKGAGLGLAIVKEMVEKHGGTLELSSDPQKGGAKFTILMPMAAKAAGEGQ